MSRFSIYLLKQMSAPVLLITLMLGGMAWIIQAVKLLELVAGQGVSTLTYLGLTFLSMPRMLVYILPIALFCGVLYSLNKLTQESELIVMSATGRSHWQLAKPALLLAIMVAVIITSINFWLSPLSLKTLRDYRHQIQNDLAGTLIKEGTFHNPATRLTVHSKSRAPDGTYRGILLHDARDPKNITSYIAREGALVKTDNDTKFLLIDGTIHTQNSNGAPNVLDFKEYIYDISSVIQPKKNVHYSISERYVGDLLQPDMNKNYDRTHHQKMIARAHGKFSDFFTPFALILICLATILTGTMSRRGQSKRNVIGSALALTFSLLSFWTLGVASNSLTYLPLIYGLPCFTIGAALIWLVTAPDLDHLRQKLTPAKQDAHNKGGVA